MVNRSKRQYIGFLLSILAIIVWSWFVSQDLRLFYSQVQDSGYNYNQVWLRGPNFFYNFQPLFDRLSSFSQVGAIVLIGTSFIYLAYQSIFPPAHLRESVRAQRVTN